MMAVIAGCLGLRSCEIAALQWSDFTFAEKSTVMVRRSVVKGRVGDCKTSVRSGCTVG